MILLFFAQPVFGGASSMTISRSSGVSEKSDLDEVGCGCRSVDMSELLKPHEQVEFAKTKLTWNKRWYEDFVPEEMQEDYIGWLSERAAFLAVSDSNKNFSKSELEILSEDLRKGMLEKLKVLLAKDKERWGFYDIGSSKHRMLGSYGNYDYVAALLRQLGEYDYPSSIRVSYEICCKRVLKCEDALRIVLGYIDTGACGRKVGSTLAARFEIVGGVVKVTKMDGE